MTDEFHFHDWPGAAEYQGRMDRSSVWGSGPPADTLTARAGVRNKQV